MVFNMILHNQFPLLQTKFYFIKKPRDLRGLFSTRSRGTSLFCCDVLNTALTMVLPLLQLIILINIMLVLAIFVQLFCTVVNLLKYVTY